MTEQEARSAGYGFIQAATGQWYIEITPVHAINRNGRGYQTMTEALDALSDALDFLEPDTDQSQGI